MLCENCPFFFSCKGKYFVPFNRSGNPILEIFLDRLVERKETIKNSESSHFSNKYVLCSYYLQGVIVISCIYMIIYKYEYFFIDIDNSHDPGSCQPMDCLTYFICGKKKKKRFERLKTRCTQSCTAQI